MKAAAKKSVPAKSKAPARGLGKGLSALMSESYSQIAPAAPESKSKAQPTQSPAPEQTLEITKIRSGKYQPRMHFDEAALSELTESVRKNGVMQPILVRPVSGGYEIIAGERRWRAARAAGLDHIPAVIREMDDEQALELALVENVQRADLHPLEEGAGYQRLMDEFGYTQEVLATTVHKSRSHIANLLRLLTLPDDIRHLFLQDKISMGHARALIGLSPQNASLFALDIVHKGISVRQLEKLIRTYRDQKGPRKTRAKQETAESGNVIAMPEQAQAMPSAAPRHNGPKDPDILALEETLSENLGLKVSIDDRGQSGEIMIAYESLEQLDEILRRLGGSI
jgi:ParB family chromosome partitioning protein